MSGLPAQAQSQDLTVPIAVIIVCAVVIFLTLILQRVQARRRPPAEEDLRSGPEVPQ